MYENNNMKLSLAIDYIKSKYPTMPSNIEQRIIAALTIIDEVKEFLGMFNAEDLDILYKIEMINPSYFPGLSESAAKTILALHNANPALPVSLLLDTTRECSLRNRPWESLRAFSRIARSDSKQINKENITNLINLNSDLFEIKSFDIQKQAELKAQPILCELLFENDRFFKKAIDKVNYVAKIEMLEMTYNKNNKKIPNKIHFIWLGGTLPKKYQDNIIKLAVVAKRSGFEITLWTDNPIKQANNTARNLHDFVNITIADDNLVVANLKIRHINELMPVIEADPLYKYNNLAKKFSYCINRELISFKNYASASDFLRLEIIRQEGGYYFDTDTGFNLNHDSKLVADAVPHFGIITNILLSCVPSISDCNLMTVLDYSGCNDIIAAQPNHRVLIDAITMAIDNYLKFDKNYVSVKENIKLLVNTTKMDLKRSPFGPNSPIYFDRLSTTSDRANLSIEAAGPAVFLEALKQLWKSKDNNTLKALSSLGQVTTVCNAGKRDLMKIAGIYVTSNSDQTWLKKEKKYSSFDDTEIPNARFVL